MSGPTIELLETADALRLVIGRLARRLRQQSLGGLTPSQRSVLTSLERHGSMTMSRVADHERISRPSATGIVGRLDDQGLVRREPAEGDGRARVVHLTDAGRQLVATGRAERTALLARYLERLDPDEFAAMRLATGALTRMLDGDP